jgi:hypothetical protein
LHYWLPPPPQWHLIRTSSVSGAVDDLAPVIAKSARLQQEIDEVLTQAKKKEEEVTWPTCQALANFAL